MTYKLGRKASQLSKRTRFASMALAALFTLGGILAFSAVPKTQAATCDQLTFRSGSYGTCVRYIQRFLNNYNLNETGRLVVDGDFGPRTKARVLEFQTKEDRVGDVSRDGIVGPQTWSRLCNAKVHDYLNFTEYNNLYRLSGC